ncbi:unnamed protein product [Bathycoccus prasinos]
MPRENLLLELHKALATKLGLSTRENRWKNAEKLREHEKRGEANRARLANVHRKAAAATSAESAFRKCVSSLMPELISLWDEKFELGQIDFRAWNDSKEKKVDGITLQTLEETAKSIDDF